MFLATSQNDPNKSFNATGRGTAAGSALKTPFKKKAVKSFMSDLMSSETPGAQGAFANPLINMQDQYLKELEENYEVMQDTKKAKKYQILKCIRKI